MRKEIIINNQVGELKHVERFIDEIGIELGLSMEMRMDLNLVLEEMVSNIIYYAYPEGTDARIELSAESDGGELTLRLTDQGKEFDPTSKEGVDVETNPAERELGGMGIFITKHIMDRVTYQRIEGKNLLTMKKKLNDK